MDCLKGLSSELNGYQFIQRQNNRDQHDEQQDERFQSKDDLQRSIFRKLSCLSNTCNFVFHTNKSNFYHPIAVLYLSLPRSDGRFHYIGNPQQKL